MFNNMENRDLYFDDLKKDRKKKGIFVILIYIILIIILMIGVIISSANFLNATIRGNEMIIKPDKPINDDDSIFDFTPKPELKVIFTEQKDTKIRIKNAYPVSEAKALEDNNLIKFQIKNERNSARYTVTLKDYENDELKEQYKNRISHQYLNYYLKNENTGAIYKGRLSDLDILDSKICSGIINKDETISFSISVWLDENADNDAQDSYYVGRLHVTVEGE